MKSAVSLTPPKSTANFNHDEIFCFNELGSSSTDAVRLATFEILYIKSGQGTLAVDVRRYQISDNTICCLSPGQHRSMEFCGEVQGYRITWSQQLLHLVDTQLSYLPSERVTPSSPELIDLITRMHQEYLKAEQKSNEILVSLMRLFMTYLKRAVPCDNEQVLAHVADSEIVQNFFTMLQNNFATMKLVADYADRLCITPNYLNAVVKRQTGFPASHHIQQCIILEAKRQAVHFRLRMKEVANRLGFDDCAHFSKFFKNYSGMNFSTFKRNFA